MTTSEGKKTAYELNVESPTLLNIRSNGVSHGLFKSHMQSVHKQVSFKDEGTISNSRMRQVNFKFNSSLSIDDLRRSAA